MTRWTLLAIGLSAYGIGLIALAPATLFDRGLDRSSESRLRLAEAEGTIWSGSGRIEIRDAGQHLGLAKGVAWRVRPWSLLRGQIAFEAKLDQTPKSFPVIVSLSHVEVADAHINLPATVLGLAVPRLAPLGLTGDLFLNIRQLQIDRKKISANLILQWAAAGSTHSPISPLGGYELQVEHAGAAHRASLRTLQGPLELQGEGSWGNGTQPVFLITARVPPQHQQQLAPLLRLIAIERGDGRFDLAL